MAAKKKIKVFIDPSLYKVLLAQKDRTGRSISSIVAEAIQNYMYHTEMQMEVRRAGELINLVSRELDDIREEMAAFQSALQRTNHTLQDLVKWTRVAAFWGALLVELSKIRIFQTRALTDKEYDLFKEAWHAAHKYADKRIYSLIGEKVWKESFDPGKKSK